MQLTSRLQSKKIQEATAAFKTLTNIDHCLSWLMGEPADMADQDYRMRGHLKELQQVLAQIFNMNMDQFQENWIECEVNGEKIRFEQVSQFGEDRIKASIGHESILLSHVSTLNTFQRRVQFAVRQTNNGKEIIGWTGDIRRGNIQSEHPITNGKMSDVTKITYKNGSVWFFKPINTTMKFMINASTFAGVPDTNSRIAERSLCTYMISEVLGFHVIPKTVLSENWDGVRGYIQEKAPGESCRKCFKELHNLGKLGALALNAEVVRQFIELQLLDALTGEADRHDKNYFIDLETNKLSGIDNDASWGYLVTHPNDMITLLRTDGYLPDKEFQNDRLTEKEIKKLKHLSSLGLPDPIASAVEFSHVGRSVFLPPVMDTNMVEKFSQFTNQFLWDTMASFNFTEDEKHAASSRLEAIKFHIDVLKQQNERGRYSIIDPKDWGSEMTMKRLKLDEVHSGNAVTTCTSYLQRDIMLAADKFPDYVEPSWVGIAYDKGLRSDTSGLTSHI